MRFFRIWVVVALWLVYDFWLQSGFTKSTAKHDVYSSIRNFEYKTFNAGYCLHTVSAVSHNWLQISKWYRNKLGVCLNLPVWRPYRTKERSDNGLNRLHLNSATFSWMNNSLVCMKGTESTTMKHVNILTQNIRSDNWRLFISFENIQEKKPTNRSKHSVDDCCYCKNTINNESINWCPISNEFNWMKMRCEKYWFLVETLIL